MSVIDQEERISKLKKLDNVTSQNLRSLARGGSKNLKTQWIQMGQAVYGIWRDKLFEYWGYQKFDQYTEKDLGIRKAVAMKILKTYLFLENYEPDALKTQFVERDPGLVPDLDAINVLRLARNRKELDRMNYDQLRRLVFDKAAAASDVRKALKRILAEINGPDEEEAAKERKASVVRKFKQAVQSLSIEGFDAALIERAEKLSKDLIKEL